MSERKQSERIAKKRTHEMIAKSKPMKFDLIRGKYFPSNSSWFPRDLKVVPYFFKKSWKSKKVRPSNIQLFKLGFHGGPSFFDFQLFYQQKFPGKEIECGLAAVFQLYASLHAVENKKVDKKKLNK